MTLSDLGLRVFHVPGRAGCIDIAIPGDDGVLRSQINGETLEQIQARYPGCVVGDLYTVSEASLDMFRDPPKAITRERFLEMLEVLPPDGWTVRDKWETFKMSERTYGTITGIYAYDHANGKYYAMADSETMAHEDIVKACKAVQP